MFLRYSLQLILTLLGVTLFGISGLLAQQAHSQKPNILSEIKRDFQEGTIDKDQKILYQLYAGFRPKALPGKYNESASFPVKCGFPALMEYERNKNNLSAGTKAIAEELTRTTLQAEHTYESPGGHFIIHYDTSGEDAVPEVDDDPEFGNNGIPDYIDWVAAAADSSWRHEVDKLGFTNPVEGPDNPYPIYFKHISFYGYTDYGYRHEPSIPDPTFILLNSRLDENAFANNDDDNPTRGAIRVTVAHELKHAIQYTNSEWYGWNGSPDYSSDDLSPHAADWSEMDATLMEEVVYDHVNDYYNYIEDSGLNPIFLSAGHTVPASYAGVTWAIYYWERYGDPFWPAVWERIGQRFAQEKGKTNPDFLTMIEAVSSTLEEDFNDQFEASFPESHLWHYASGNSNSQEGYGFDEKLSYPNPTIDLTLAARDSIFTFRSLPAMSADYIRVTKGEPLEDYVQIFFEYDSTFTNIGVIGIFSDGSVETLMRPGNTSGKLDISTTWEWTSIRELGIVVANSSETGNTQYRLVVTTTIPEKITLAQNYPNPFNPGTTINFTLPQESDVELRVYDVAGRLVSTLRNEVMPAGYHEVTFNAGNLASGVYFYRLMTDRRVITRKMTLIK